MALGRRIALTVQLNLDPVPGTFNTEESAREEVQHILDQTIPHYVPGVSLYAVPNPPPVVREQETLPFGDWKMRKDNWVRDDYYKLPDLSKQQPESD